MHVPLLFGPYGSAALEQIPSFAEYGANALWFHGFDPCAFDACAAHGISACVEFKTFRADFNARPELIPTGVDGEPIRYGRLVQGVCLSRQEYLEEVPTDIKDEVEIHLAENMDSVLELALERSGGAVDNAKPAPETPVAEEGSATSNIETH